MKLRTSVLILLIFLNIEMIAQTTTVITHGYSIAGSDPVNTWMLQMAYAIRNRIGGAVIRIYNKTTGMFDYQSGTGSNTILLFDWMEDSNDLESGYSESAGAALFAAIMNGKNSNVFSVSNLHFIGHSRGCAVNSEAIERLIVEGVPVAQATYLDAHDWGSAGVLITDYDVNPDTINSGVEGWQGIGWADSYWQDALLDLNGRPVDGTYSVYLGTIGHSATHDWYQETITDTSRHEGFYYSISGGGANQRPAVTGLQRMPFFTYDKDGIVNGNFQRGSHISETFPGWWYHGGAGTADIDNDYLMLDYYGYNKLSNRFYIPPYAKQIKYDYLINIADEDAAVPDIDRLVVLLNGNVTVNSIWMDAQMSVWAENSFNVSNLTNSVKQIEFRLLDEFNAFDYINSEVFIDNVRFVMSGASDDEQNKNNVKINICPDPVIDKAVITYKLEENSNISICVYDIFGRQVASLIDNINQPAGQHNVIFDATAFNNGLYFYKINVNNYIYSGKIIVAKR